MGCRHRPKPVYEIDPRQHSLIAQGQQIVCHLNISVKRSDFVVDSHAVKQLNEVFGIAVKNLPDDKQLFVLINKLELDSNPEKSHLKSSQHESATRGNFSLFFQLL